MKLGNVLFTLAIAAAFATVSMPAPASAQADDILSREATPTSRISEMPGAT
jgi:hypothetical protein